jgi:hypothetical protein
MFYPAGVQLRTVKLSAMTDFSGAYMDGVLLLTPSKSLKWLATGQFLVSNPVMAYLSSGSASIIVPSVQSGFVDVAGNAVTTWEYVASLSVSTGGVDFNDKRVTIGYGLGDYALDFALG